MGIFENGGNGGRGGVTEILPRALGRWMAQQTCAQAGGSAWVAYLAGCNGVSTVWRSPSISKSVNLESPANYPWRTSSAVVHIPFLISSTYIPSHFMDPFSILVESHPFCQNLLFGSRFESIFSGERKTNDRRHKKPYLL